MKQFGEIVKGIDYYQRPGSYGVLIKAGKIGVVRSLVFDKYFLVGGGIENGETEIEALQREALEEIGFEIEIAEKIGAATEYFYDNVDKKHIAKICNFYRLILRKKVESSPESQLLWIDKNELDEMYHRSHQWIVETELEQV